jgi:hypothetical protein
MNDTILEINKKMDNYIERLKKHPPGIIGHLKEKINLNKMLKIKQSIEESGWLPDCNNLKILKRKKELNIIHEKIRKDRKENEQK